MPKETHRVWAWGNKGQKTLHRGTKKECIKFRKNYTGYRKNEMYITELEGE
jgi:hypothetical protein